MMIFTYAWLTCTTTPWVPLHVPLTLALVGLAAALSLAPVRLAAWVNGWLSHVKYKKGLHVQHAKTYHTCKYTCIFSKRCIFLFINLCTYLPNNDVNRLR